MDVTALRCCMLFNLQLCWRQSWPECGVVLSVMWSFGSPWLLMVCGNIYNHLCSVTTCAGCVWLLGWIKSFQSILAMFHGDFNLMKKTITGVTGIPYFLSLSVLISVFSFLMIITKPPISIHKNIVTVSSSFPCGMALSVCHCRLQGSYSAFLKSFFSFFWCAFFLLLSFHPVMAERTRPPLGWWLALSTTSWETGTMECPLAPSMSSRQYMCAFCECNCLFLYVYAVFVWLLQVVVYEFNCWRLVNWWK